MNWLASFGLDLRVGVRQLGNSPVFTGVAVASVALGIGANTAVFSLVNDVLLRSLPVRDPGRLVALDGTANYYVRAAGDPASLFTAIVTLGTVLGAMTARGASRYVESMLFGLAPGDPLTYISAATGLMVVGLLASLIPARRAARVNPLIALRAE